MCTVIGKLKHFIKYNIHSKQRCVKDDVIKLLEFIIDNMLVVFDEQVFRLAHQCVLTVSPYNIFFGTRLRRDSFKDIKSGRKNLYKASILSEDI